MFRSGAGATLAAAYSLLGNIDGTYSDSGGNQVGTSASPLDPLLEPLGDNGGDTFTHHPMMNSPVIDRGNPAFSPPPEMDQRGSDRVQDGDRNGTARIDIGAVEVLNLRVDSMVDENDGDTSSGSMSMREAIELANTTGSNLITFAPSLNNQTISLTMGSISITSDLTIQGNVTVDAQGNSRIFTSTTATMLRLPTWCSMDSRSSMAIAMSVAQSTRVKV